MQDASSCALNNPWWWSSRRRQRGARGDHVGRTDGDRWDGSGGGGPDARLSLDLFFLSASPFPISTASARLGDGMGAGAGVTKRDCRGRGAPPPRERAETGRDPCADTARSGQAGVHRGRDPRVGSMRGHGEVEHRRRERRCGEEGRDPRHLPSASWWRHASWARSVGGFHARTRRGGAQAEGEAVWGGGPGSTTPSIGGKRTFHPCSTGRTVHHSNMWTPTLHS
jgi:hypothetical protein